MQEINNLYEYIKNKYKNYKEIKNNENEIIVAFHKDFEMRINIQTFCKIYFNEMFYYDVDYQDIKETIDDFFSNQYAFCKTKKNLIIIKLKEFQDKAKYLHIWTIEKTLK